MVYLALLAHHFKGITLSVRQREQSRRLERGEGGSNMKRGGKENRKDKTGICSILSAWLKPFTVEDGERGIYRERGK